MAEFSNLHKATTLFTALLLIVAVLFFSVRPTAAAEFSNRSVRLSTGIPSATATYSFGLTFPSTSVVGSLDFQFCVNSPIESFPCTAPAGFDISAATIAVQTGNIGFTVDAGNTTANRLVLTRVAAAGVAIASTYDFASVTNPSTSGQTVFVRMASYTSIDGTGAVNDKGAVALSVNNAFSVGAFVPPYLTFCVGVTVAINCSVTTGFTANFGEFSATSATLATTQFAVATNDFTGYLTFVNGQTMTSGNNPIAPLVVNAASNPGNAQFGMNLRANSSPTGGNDPVGPGIGTPTANYNTPDSFRYVDGELIASSGISTDFTRYTISYLINVPSNQPPGFYATTLTFTAVAAF